MKIELMVKAERTKIHEGQSIDNMLAISQYSKLTISKLKQQIKAKSAQEVKNFNSLINPLEQGGSTADIEAIKDLPSQQTNGSQ